MAEHLQFIEHLPRPHRDELHSRVAPHLNPGGSLHQQQQLTAGVTRLGDRGSGLIAADLGLIRQQIEGVGPGAPEEVAAGQHHPCLASCRRKRSARFSRP
jgi:hypothetical protein